MSVIVHFVEHMSLAVIVYVSYLVQRDKSPNIILNEETSLLEAESLPLSKLDPLICLHVLRFFVILEDILVGVTIDSVDEFIILEDCWESFYLIRKTIEKLFVLLLHEFLYRVF